MRCELCQRSTSGLIRFGVYSREGIQVCEACYNAIDSNRHKPYSKVMDRLAMVEAGYLANRKLARLRGK